MKIITISGRPGSYLQSLVRTVAAGILILFIFTYPANCQYVFKDEIRLPCTNIKNQQITGTCWSFATTSFLESEIIRMGKGAVNLSEMFNVRMVYNDKALNYVLRQGKANFDEGGLAHDVIRTAAQYGIMPLSAYSGEPVGDSLLDHRELSSVLKAFLDAVIKNGHPGQHWFSAYQGILNAYMGMVPDSFSYQGSLYTPSTFVKAMGIHPGDYSSFTSFTHHPFHTFFILEIPDNYSNGSYFNVKLDELTDIVNYALDHGFTLTWDGDVSEKGFSQIMGLAVLPADSNRMDLFENPGKELTVTPASRQLNFMNYNTTDDHLMHLIGRAQDQNHKVYYILKNSWGKLGPYHGYLYMSEAYFRMKTISVTLNHAGIPKNIRQLMK